MATGSSKVGFWLVALILTVLTAAAGLHTTLAQEESGLHLIPSLLQSYLQNLSAKTTLLPDGRTLTLADSEILLQSASSNATQSVASIQRIALPQRRRFSTATVVPDGRVFIWGGLDANNQLLRHGLWFDPATNAITETVNVGLLPRAGHTATLLRDGRLLIVGGWSSSESTLSSAELFDPRSSQAQIVNSEFLPTRVGANAALLLDGKVLISGGIDVKGEPLNTAIAFDPVTQLFHTLPNLFAASHPEMAAPSLVTSFPATNTGTFPADGVLALQFSAPMDMGAIGTKTITLLGPGGNTPINVVGAGDGHLAFITPDSNLLPGARYTLFLQGVKTSAQVELSFTAIDFSVAALPRSVNSNAPSATSESSMTIPLQSGGTAAVASPTLHLMVGESSASISSCTSKNAPAFCRTMSVMRDGAWYPGEDAEGTLNAGRWRLNKSDMTPPEIAQAALAAQAPPGSGVTGIRGRIEQIDGQPIAHVDVSIGGKHVLTGASGDFTLTGVSPGHSWLYVDGTSANRLGREYGQFVVGVTLKKGVVLPLGYRMYLPRILPRDKIQIASPTTQDIVLTHPDVPGLEVHIPKGTVIKDYKGNIVTELAIVPTPVDRSPFPTPANFPVFFSIEPSGATVQNISPQVNQGIQIVYPNYSRLESNAKTDFYVYHPDEGWRIYAHGRVTSDGSQVASESDVSVHKIMPFGAVRPPADSHPGDAQQGKECGACSGDPVDLWSDTLEESQVDVRIKDIVPITLSRLFHLSSVSGETRMFGGWRSNYDIYLYDTSDSFQNMSLRLPDGNLLAFTQVSALPGDAYTGTYTGSPSPWYGATLEGINNDSVRCNGVSDPYCFLLTLKDGTQFQFAGENSTGPTFIADRFGNKLTLTYSSGLLQQITSPSGRYISFSYNANNNVSAVTDNTGRTWNYSYTAQSSGGSSDTTWQSLDTVTYPDSTAWHYTYNTNASNANWGTLLSVIDRNGHTAMTNSYTQLSGGVTGNYTSFYVSGQTLADNTTYTFARSALGTGTQEMDVTDPNGNVRKVVMDPASGYTTSVTEAANSSLARTTTYVRDSNGLIDSMTDPLLRQTSYTYDSLSNVTSITRLAGTSNAVTEKFTYTTPFSQLATYADGLGHTTSFAYTYGCLTGILDPLGHTTTIACNVYGQPTTLQDALGHVTTLTYKGYDLFTVSDPLNRTGTYTVDFLGRVTSLSDPFGNAYTRQYDLNDRVVAQTDPTGVTTSAKYDAMGDVASVTLPSKGTINYGYDLRNRLTSRTDALNQSESWSYDGLSNLLSHKDRKGQDTSYNYDALNRRILTAYADKSNITASYDAGDRLDTLSDSLNGNLSFGWDGLDRLTQATNALASVTYTYDAANRRATMTAGSQAQVAYTYDNANRLTQLVQGSETVAFSYDNANRRTQLTLPNGVTEAYAYDNDNEVTGLTYKQSSGTQIGSLTYGYDNDGHQISQAGSLAPSTLAAATSGTNAFDLNNRQTSLSGKTLSYDADGNLISDSTYTYTWNARNQLTSVKQGSSNIAVYTYDAMGRRSTKSINGAATTAFLYDRLNPIQEVQGGTITPILTGLSIDEYFARTESSGRTYFLSDVLGSTVGLTNTSGTLVQEYQYGAFGDVTAQSQGFTNPYQYAGRENDGYGLYYYRSRYFSSTAKRFVSEDPIGFVGGQPNFYVYVADNPVSYKDPFGLWSLSIQGYAVVGGGVTITGPGLFSLKVSSISFKAGVGVGGGFAYNPRGERPDKNAPCGSNGIGLNVQAGVSALGASLGLGGNYGGTQNPNDPTNWDQYGGVDPDLSFAGAGGDGDESAAPDSKGFGLDFDASATVELTHNF